ncbi:MAG: 16S rRNA (guanine(527)-N(7))-methyltransferase RsmG [Candidatus Binatia bacterium]
MPYKIPPTELERARLVLREGSAALGLSLSEGQVQAFLSYLTLLILWNKTFNLTSLRDPVEIVRLHFLDSLAVAPFVEKSGPLMDLGSGAGFPGLPLAILLPSTSTTLVEPRRKRANFLRAAARAISATQVVVVEDRVERLDRNITGLFSTVVFRAVGRADFFLRAARGFLQEGGRCLVLHGPSGTKLFDEIGNNCSALGYSKAKIESYHIPPGKEARTIIIAYT